MRGLLILSLVSCLLGIGTPAEARADIAVIAHRDNPVQTMSAHELSDLYLGRSRSLGGGDRKVFVTPYEHPADSSLRENFFRKLNGMNLKQLNAYWARLRFSGAVLPPDTLPNSRAVIEAVGKNRAAIGYVEADSVDSSVKVLLRLPVPTD